MAEAKDANSADVQRAKKERKSIGTCLLAVGVVGLLSSLLPWCSLVSYCPYLVKSSGGGCSPISWNWAALVAHVDPWRSPTATGGDATSAGGFKTRRGVDPVTGLLLFSADELKPYDGTDPDARILLGMGGDVFDVTDLGRQFYGAGAGYQLFAGRDSTRCLALGSLDETDLARGGDVADFNEQQLGMLKEQHTFYKDKYPRVGVLVKEA
jgi:hypothetical protein